VSTLALQRCLNHATRMAAARCPSCRSYYCRECVTEHDGRVICQRCLAALTQGATSPSSGLALRSISAFAGLGLSWLCFYGIGQLLVRLGAI
jgi:hypothetical protein